ncbi:hypothetical protein ACWDYK_38710, partial [Streptomyces anthocyanicus]
NEPGLLPLLTRVYGTPTPHHPYNPTTRTAAEDSIWQGFADFTALTQQTTPDSAGRPRPDAPPEGSPAADPPPPYPRDDRPTGAVPEEPPAADPPPPYPRDDSASEAAEDDALPDIPPPTYPEAVAAGTPAPVAGKREPWRPKPGMRLPLAVILHPQTYDIVELAGLNPDALSAIVSPPDTEPSPAWEETISGAVRRAVARVRADLNTLKGITMTNVDLLVSLPDDEHLSVWAAVAQGMANHLQHRVKAKLPGDADNLLEICPQ